MSTRQKLIRHLTQTGIRDYDLALRSLAMNADWVRHTIISLDGDDVAKLAALNLLVDTLKVLFSILESHFSLGEGIQESNKELSSGLGSNKNPNKENPSLSQDLYKTKQQVELLKEKMEGLQKRLKSDKQIVGTMSQNPGELLHKDMETIHARLDSIDLSLSDVIRKNEELFKEKFVEIPL